MKLSKIPILPAFVRRKIDSRVELQKIAGNFGWLFFDKVLKMAVGIAVFSWVARYLGPEKLGLWNYAIAFVAVFAPLATLGLNNIVVKELVNEPGQRDNILGTTYILKLCGGLLTVLMSFAAILIVRPNHSLSQALILIVGFQYVFQSFEAIDLFYQSQWMSKYSVIARSIAFLVISAGKIALILLKIPLIWFVVLSSAEFLLASVLFVITYRFNRLNIKNWRFRWSLAKRLLRDSWPLILSSVSITIQAYIDQIMLGDMIGEGELGQYSSAMKLITVLGFIPMIIQSSVAPEITKAKQMDEDLYFYKLKRVYQIMFIVFLGIGVPLFFLSDYIVLFLYGEEYRTAGYLLALLAIRLFFSNFGVAKSLFITNDNLFKYAFITSLAGSVLNILFNYLLIPHYASVGAIWATIISFSITIFIIDAIYKRTRRHFFAMLHAIIDIKSYIRLFQGKDE